MGKIKKFFWWSFLFCCVFVAVVVINYGIVSLNAAGRTFNDVADVLKHEYGLILATSPITPGGSRNFYFDNRITSAVELYKVGKVKRIIASGGDYTQDAGNVNGCDEPKAIRDSLIKKGVPDSCIILDYDGIRTLNSIVKVKYVYGVDSVVIISQMFHNERAIWQADHYELNAVGYNAAHSHILANRVKNIVREFFARVKLMVDMAFGVEPQFDGEEKILMQ